jgi:uncharacterized protein YdaT
MREWYRRKSETERRAIVESRDPEKVRAADRKRSKKPERIAYNGRNTARWRKENPEKYAAHVTLNNAVRAGKVKKQPCEVCGSTTRVHAHHDDYSKPLEVRWRCPLHHAELRAA